MAAAKALGLDPDEIGPYGVPKQVSYHHIKKNRRPAHKCTQPSCTENIAKIVR